MKTSLVSVSAVATLVAAVSLFRVDRPLPTHPTRPATNAEGTKLLSGLPVAFVPNLGQWRHSARFVARIGAMTVLLDESGWTFTLVEQTAEKGKGADNASARGVTVRMTFTGARTPELVAEARLPGRHNYFLGNDPSHWRGDVPLYGAVRYREVHPGIDVLAREQDGHFEYDLVLEPGAELEPVEIAVEGIERMRLDTDALVLETRLGPVRMPAPLSWEEGPSGEKSLVTCRYVLRGADRFGFEVAGRRPGWALVVDPGLVWSTFLGGSSNVVDEAYALALDAQGAVTIAGKTYSPDFPTTSGAFDTSYNGGFFDTFVTRLSPTGSSLIYSTFLGGTGYEWSYALTLDAQGAATVAGLTDSTNFPTTPGAFDTTHNGNEDAFVTRLSPSGSSLVYSTLLGGTNDDSARAVALDAQGAATVAGSTQSSGFPTTSGAFDTSYSGGVVDAFVARLSPLGSSLVYSTFLGGTDDDIAFALALDAAGAATVAGHTNSIGFPTTPGAFDKTTNGFLDAFVTRLSPTGTSLVYSTFLGGTGDDIARALVLDAQGATTVAGYTWSPNFPTTSGALDTTHNGRADAFVTRLSPLGTSLGFSTFLGGTGDEAAHALALDAQGAISVAGYTGSDSFPTTPGAFDTSYNGGGDDAYVTRLGASGSSLVYSTFLGGSAQDGAFALALDARGAATIAGWTGSTDFPTTPGAFDTSHSGGGDAFVTRLDLLPTGVVAFGRSSPGCTGPLAISVGSMPRIGNAAFAFTCGSAPPNATGALVLAGSGLTVPIRHLGVEVWLEPLSFFVGLPASSDSRGACDFGCPIPSEPSLIGQKLSTQFFWRGPGSPPPCPPLGLSASNALEITFQS